MIEGFNKTRIEIDGKSYNSIDEVPEPQRTELKKMITMVQQGRGKWSVIRFLLRHILKKYKGQVPKELLHALGLENTGVMGPRENAIDVTGSSAESGFSKSGTEESLFSGSSSSSSKSTTFSQASSSRSAPVIDITNGYSPQEKMEGSGIKPFLIFIVIGIVALYFLR